MKLNIEKYKKNPIVVGGGHSWRKAGTFNPGVIYDNGKFYMYERATESLRPFICHIGLLESDDGYDFKLVKDTPVLSAKDLGYDQGTVEDPRVVKIEDRYYMTFAYRPYTYNCCPNGLGVPDYTPLVGKLDVGVNHTLSAIAVSDDLINFEVISKINTHEVDERDNILFPEKIDGRYCLLRRPKGYVGEAYGCTGPSIWISYSDDLETWTDPVLLAKAENKWEGGKIGGGGQPIRTEEGWLILYHGVDEKGVYRVGMMLLELDNPEKIIARSDDFIMEPTEYYEQFGLVIPNVIFPTGNVVKDGTLYIYYGSCDTSIAVATVPLEDVLNYLKQYRV